MEREGQAMLAALAATRGSMYEFLARIYRQEVDEELLDQMAGMMLPSEADPSEIHEGYQMLARFLEQRTASTVTDLAADYALIFLGAGATGKRPYPYESVYTSPRGLVMQDARDQVLQLYREEGLDRAADFNEPEDHIALELEFMAYLCQRTAEALNNGDRNGALTYLEKQRFFLNKHLIPWVLPFCSDVQRVARQDFYRAVAKITSGYLTMDQDVIRELVEEIQET